MKGKVTSVLLLLLGGAVPTLWLVLFQQSGDDVRERKHLERLVRSLHLAQRKTDNITSQQETEDDRIVKLKFPWLPKKNTLPNFFHRTKHDRSDGFQDNEYVTGSLVFGDNPRAADVPLMECVRRISVTNYLSTSPIMSSGNRLAWESADDKMKKFRNKIKIHRGSYSFGVCESLNVSCSYVMMFRNPLEQALSNYQYCKYELTDELCQGVNANKVTLRQWILFHGSELFKQLIFSPHFCTDSVNVSVTVPDEVWFGNKHDSPCWLKQKVLMEKFSKIDIIHATSYIVRHLEQWFGVVGLYDQMADSLKMFQTVYKLPFTKCYETKKTRPDVADEDVTSENSATSVVQRKSEFFDENDLHYLRDDIYVKEALSADNMIYKEAARLFNIQKQLYTNKLRAL
ncbi:uncharacterized protein LOC121377253 [Gigantopelta aegis]|uniref:uncharacterized protein LOC121377253 n=1 Tax=Gigantopelta aegis TaxID=1735272 RepID=UPI001B88D187|nr:uncharacterized protein LOC121377253 [Gigantopelta aegis]